MKQMKVAITGGIGSGKSYVCSVLKKHGIDVYDCDDAAKRIMHCDSNVRQSLIDLIGKDAYVDDNINRPLISSYILSSVDNAARVNAIVHPAVAEDFIKSEMSIMECAILFSSGFDALVDKVVCVTAPIEVRVERVIKRDGISREKALDWINCQMEQSELIARSDYVVENDGKCDVELLVEKMIKDLNLLKH